MSDRTSPVDPTAQNIIGVSILRRENFRMLNKRACLLCGNTPYTIGDHTGANVLVADAIALLSEIPSAEILVNIAEVRTVNVFWDNCLITTTWN